MKVKSPEDEQSDRNIEEINKPDELEGNLESSPDDYEKLAKSVIEDDGKQVDEGELVNEALAQNMQNFVPSMMFQNLVQNFQNAKHMYGERMIRKLTGHDADYVERNIKIPEFQRDIQGKIKNKVREMQDDGVVSEQGKITAYGMQLAGLIMYMQELDKLIPKGIFGDEEHKQHSHYGIGEDIRPYKNHDRYHDIDLKKSIKVALRRGHGHLTKDDLRVKERESKGNIVIMYAVDASGSMRGDKILMAKKAGVALAFKATEEKNKVGTLAFAGDIEEHLVPSIEFWPILEHLINIKATGETNVARTIHQAMELFPTDQDITKHLIFLTDASPTTGDDPHEEALKAAAEAQARGITISVIGIQVDPETEEFARNLAEVGEGNFYMITNLEELDQAVLQDYKSLK